MFLQFLLQEALDVYQLEVLAICLLNLLNIFHHNPSVEIKLKIQQKTLEFLNDNFYMFSLHKLPQR